MYDNALITKIYNIVPYPSEDLTEEEKEEISAEGINHAVKFAAFCEIAVDLYDYVCDDSFRVFTIFWDGHYSLKPYNEAASNTLAGFNKHGLRLNDMYNLYLSWTWKAGLNGYLVAINLFLVYIYIYNNRHEELKAYFKGEKLHLRYTERGEIAPKRVHLKYKDIRLFNVYSDGECFNCPCNNYTSDNCKDCLKGGFLIHSNDETSQGETSNDETSQGETTTV